MNDEQQNMDREVVVGIVNQNQIILGQLGQVLAINVAVLERALNPLMVVPDPFAGVATAKPPGHFCPHGTPIGAWCTDCDIERTGSEAKPPGQFCAHGVALEDDCAQCGELGLVGETFENDEPAED